MTRLTRLEVAGFRASRESPGARLREEPAVIYAPNSHGKTSLAEAIEFLLTGSTSRRLLVSSAVREFADALRNAHLAAGGEVIVRATVEAANGHRHEIERKLLTDYTSRGECTSLLRIDGQDAKDASSLGIALAQAPLAAPCPDAARAQVCASGRTNATHDVFQDAPRNGGTSTKSDDASPGFP